MKFSSSFTAASALTLALAFTPLSMSHAQLSTPVLMHYMPWFTLDGNDTHWTRKLYDRDGLYLMERYQQNGTVAAHYTPLIGPYSSKDEDTISLHLDLLRQAGVKGVIINWYGISNRNDYPVLKEAADTIIRLSNTAGMLWTLCYEDRTIDKDLTETGELAQLQADWEYIRDAYIGKFSGTMLRDAENERPVFLQFGPVTFDEKSTWVNMLNTVFSDISERPYLLGLDKLYRETPLPNGGFNWPIGDDLMKNKNPSTDMIEAFHTTFYDRAQEFNWYPVVGSTFPRFRDYYLQSSKKNAEPKFHWNITVPSFNGDTIAISIDAARERGADFLQAVTWNDWMEGTTFEPSAEEGYTQLLRLQEHILGRIDEDSMRNAVLAYNDIKASEWQQCDRVSPDQKEDCKHPKQVPCEAAGCCFRPNSQPGPWCFKKVALPEICEQPAPAVRNCTRTPEDRLCYCKPTTSAPTSSSPTTSSEVPTVSPTLSPTEAPTALPTEVPTEFPTEAPTGIPTASPTEAATEAPTVFPTLSPTEAPTALPTEGLTTSSPTTKCLDVAIRFKEGKNRKYRTCNWIKKKTHRINKFCKHKKRWNDKEKVLVCSRCCETCQKCTHRMCTKKC